MRQFLLWVVLVVFLSLLLSFPFPSLRGVNWDLHEVGYTVIALGLLANVLRKR